MPEVPDVVRLVEMEEATNWFDLTPWKLYGLLGLAAVLLLVVGYRRIRRFLRRRRGPRLHPRLRKYGGDPAWAADDRHAKLRRGEAVKILATSSGPNLAGFEVVEQVEAVVVDGFQRPEDAIEGLKAVAAMKGANAVTSVSASRGANGRYHASGDAVKVWRKGQGEDAARERKAEPIVIIEPPPEPPSLRPQPLPPQDVSPLPPRNRRLPAHGESAPQDRDETEPT